MGYRIAADELFEMYKEAERLEYKLRQQILRLPLYDQLRFFVQNGSKFRLTKIYSDLFEVSVKEALEAINAFWGDENKDRFKETLLLFKLNP